jgi:purine-binding chemotaxis protein CheW
MSGAQVLLVPVGADWYALELLAVREVVVAGRVEPLPGAPPAVLGLFNLRGEVVPVLDTAALLGVGAPPAGSPHLVIAETARGLAALTATGRPRTARLGSPAGPSELTAGRGRWAVGDEVAALLDLEALVAPGRIGEAA